MLLDYENITATSRGYFVLIIIYHYCIKEYYTNKLITNLYYLI